MNPLNNLHYKISFPLSAKVPGDTFISVFWLVVINYFEYSKCLWWMSLSEFVELLIKYKDKWVFLK